MAPSNPPSNEAKERAFRIKPATFGDSARSLVVEAERDGKKLSIHLAFHEAGGEEVTWYETDEGHADVISGVLQTAQHEQITKDILNEGTIKLKKVVRVRVPAPKY